MLDSAKYFLAGGVGGVLPKLVMLATVLTQTTNAKLTEPISWSFFVGLLMLFGIGGIVAVSTVENSRKVRDFIIAGIAAPALIASIVGGVEKTTEKKGAGDTAPKSTTMSFFISGAYAAAEPKLVDPTDSYNYTLQSIPYGSTDWRQNTLGYDVVVTDSQGNSKTLNINGWSEGPIKLTTKTPLQDVQINDNDGNAITKFNVDAVASGEIVVRPQIASEKDFLWALGAKGKAKVVGGQTEFVPLETNKETKNNPLLENRGE
ncbi:hypothetical protein [Vibrio nigripulchritudo]|uniref:hypothetical protein n=1 Tax=Vibrio nigripulchritudo TaxID=28173 RepID=UPI0003B212A8|nr:hypothetical protein [Vibrio nigripulchritudo]CCN69284.1 hypothetical protein VIBNISFn118_1270011 [Vibrio nigripulchritudo SFn118]